MSVHVHGRGPGHLCRQPYGVGTLSANYILDEDGSFLISETGLFLVAQDSPTVNYITDELGDFILSEAGNPMITEH